MNNKTKTEKKTFLKRFMIETGFKTLRFEDWPCLKLVDDSNTNLNVNENYELPNRTSRIGNLPILLSILSMYAINFCQFLAEIKK